MDALLEQYNYEIITILQSLPLDVDIGTPMDEVFVLRFLLSCNGDVDQAKKKISKCIDWRLQNMPKFLSMTDKIESLLKFSKAGYGGFIGDSPLFTIRVGLCDLKGIVKNFSAEEIELLLLLCEENSFQMVDKMTRKKNRIVKMITVCDMSSMSMLNVDFSFLRALASASNKSSFLYPQLVHQKIFVNTPYIIRTMFNVFNGFFNDRAKSKHVLCGGDSSSHIGKCIYLRNTDHQIPDFLGGSLKDYAQTLM